MMKSVIFSICALLFLSSAHAKTQHTCINPFAMDGATPNPNVDAFDLCPQPGVLYYIDQQQKSAYRHHTNYKVKKVTIKQKIYFKNKTIIKSRRYR